MSHSYDVIVIGAGHNGLTAAALLAKHGRRVLLLERRDVLGGLAAGEEFHPGYRTAGMLHDGGGVRRWVVDALGLAGHGLRRHAEAPPVLVPERRGRGLLLWRDPQKTGAELESAWPGDAAGYRDYRAFLTRLAPVIRRLTERVPPRLFEPGLADYLALGRAGLALRRLGHRDMMEVMRIAPMPLADWLAERFASPLLQAALAAPALHHMFTGPRSPGTVANLLLAECTDDGPVAGGAAALAAALEAAARAQGVAIRGGATVSRLIGEDGRVRGVRLADGEEIVASVVAAACDPRHLFLDLLPPAMVPRDLERSITSFRARGTAARIHLALSTYPDFASRPGQQPAVARVADGLDDLERAFDAVKYRRFSPRPVLEIVAPTVESPELAPPGHHVWSILVHFVPHTLDGGWNAQRKAELYRAVIDRLAEVAPDIEAAVVGHEVLTPADLEERYAVSGGHLHHGEHALDQLVVRPTAECARYDTPLAGLFLCGSGAHPGGGLTCAPGALAARAILDR
jgi:phytoene dehydrogenase-like protein